MSSEDQDKQGDDREQDTRSALEYTNTQYEAVDEGSEKDNNQLKESVMESSVSEIVFRRFIDTAVDAIILITDDSKILLLNHAAENIFGYSAEELTGERITTIMPYLKCEGCKKGSREGFENWANNTLGRTEQITALKKSSEEFTIELSLSDMSIEDERTLVAVIRDVTEKEELKTKLEQKTRQIELANAELEEANTLKSEFLANASHELRTPLNSMIGFLRLVTDGLCETKKEELEFIGNSLDSSEHLLSLINDLLDISKIEAGKMTLDIEKIDPNKVFDDLYILTHIQAQEKGLKLEFESPEDDSAFVRADYNKLKQILLNLVGNSIKFTEKGIVKISAEPHPDKGFVEFIVRDTGIGISSKIIGRLFNKFVQGDGSMTRKYGGTGLGLTITKSLVELMGGFIKMESEGPDKGTAVIFTVPICIASDVPTIEEFSNAGPIAVEDSSKPLILIVEDDPVIRSIIEEILGRQEFNTIWAATADDAVALARKHHPAVITLDFGLLAREHAVLSTGWDIIEVLRKDEKTKDIRYVIISGYDGPIKEKIFNDDLEFKPELLQKPFDGEVLVEKVNNLLLSNAQTT